MSVPAKYKQIGDFHEYYSGKRVAPYLTIFIGGNHEAGNYLSELYYGGWVAPNIYYMGAANVIRCGPLRIAGMSGIWKGYDYRKPHFERLPYNRDDVTSVFHIRELDVRKLLQIRTQVDLGLSHDWPEGISWAGDHESLFRKKPAFKDDALTGRLGSVAARQVLERLRPPFWFSAHLHCKFTACVIHEQMLPDEIKTLPTKESTSANGHLSNVQPPPQPQPQRLIDSEPIPNHQTTWERVNTEDSSKRDVYDAEKFEHQNSHNPRKRAHPESVSVKNSDEIDLDLESDDEELEDPREAKSKSAGTADESSFPPQQLSNANINLSPLSSHNDQVPDDIRNQLPASFARPMTDESPKLETTLPEGIVNRKTDFLALDKCLPNRHFIQLTEFPAISEPDVDYCERPYRLRYDKEWLAITRALASELTFGAHPEARIPANKGEKAYRPEIDKAMEWVEENVVKQDKLTIPLNFSITAQPYDPSVPFTTEMMPREYTNPQTSQFCQLIGIDNQFDQPEEERDARMAAGPRPVQERFNRNFRGGGRRDRRGGRGNHGPRGRGKGSGRRY